MECLDLLLLCFHEVALTEFFDPVHEHLKVEVSVLFVAFLVVAFLFVLVRFVVVLVVVVLFVVVLIVVVG